MLRRGGRGKFCIVEKCRKFLKSFFFDREVLVWLAKAVNISSKILDNRVPYQSKRVGNKFFLIQWCQNSYGRFIKLVELGTGNKKGIIAIPEGKNGNRCDIFVKKFKGFVGSSSSVFTSKNRAAVESLQASKAIELSRRAFNLFVLASHLNSHGLVCLSQIVYIWWLRSS